MVDENDKELHPQLKPAPHHHHHHHQQQQQQQQQRLQSHHNHQPSRQLNPHQQIHHHQQDQQQQQQQQHHLSLSLPLHPPPHRAPHRPPSHHPDDPKPSRDDAWSESATLTLIDAWGDRYLELNRGNLKQKHWKDVADAVNGREGGSKLPKTDVQCKNRLDTLKKKYKLEKNRFLASGNTSKWSFFSKLDELIGPSKKQKKQVLKVKKKESTDSPETDVKGFHNINTPINDVANNDSSANTKSKESADMTDSCPHGTNDGAEGKIFKKRKLQDGPFKDLARAIMKFGEVYERVEIAKQQQLMDLEKQRMEFTKDLELQRMQLFMQTQVELAKMKHGKHGSTEHYL